jgi:hypothetical protein
VTGRYRLTANGEIVVPSGTGGAERAVGDAIVFIPGH